MKYCLQSLEYETEKKTFILGVFCDIIFFFMNCGTYLALECAPKQSFVLKFIRPITQFWEIAMQRKVQDGSSSKNHSKWRKWKSIIIRYHAENFRQINSLALAKRWFDGKNYRNLLSHYIFWQKFREINILKKLPNNWFDEIFFQWE